MAIFADSNRVSISTIAEVTWGVTPSSGSPREVRITSSSLAAAKETVVSDELRADRMVSSVVETSAMSEGDLNWEFSAGSQDDYFQAFVLGTWTKQMTFDRFDGAGISVDTSSDDFDLTGFGDLTRFFSVGNFIKASGYNEPLNNTYWEITALAYADPVFTITVDVTKGDLVTEAGNSTVRIEDANDVVNASMLKINDVAAVNATSSFDKVGMFASAITAQTLNVGQYVHVEGWGYEVGTLTLTVGNPADAELVTIRDGATTDVNTKTVIFEFDVAASGVTEGNVAVVSVTDHLVSATNLAAAINAQRVLGNLECAATVSAGVVTVRNLRRENGAITETGINIALVDFANGQTWEDVYLITSLADDQMIVSPAPPENSTGSRITFKASMLRNPTGIGLGNVNEIKPQSWSIESSFNDVSQFFLQDGLRTGAFSMEVSAGSIVTGSFSFQGKETKRFSTVQFTEAAYDPLVSTDTQVMNATTNVGSISKDGATLSSAIQSISLEGDATLRNQNAVSSKFPQGIGTGRFNLTGTITAYFEDGTLYDNFLNHDTIALSWDFNDLDFNKYVFTVPALKITSDPIAPGGIDQDILEVLEFIAFRDSVSKSMFQMDRFSSVSAVTTS